jgi:Tfp pilus assembly protein PilN
MPANSVTINLLAENKNTNSPWNRIMIWITSYGRYIMISTELIVLIAFASRFSLDRKLTDLKENITEKQEILEVNKELEQEIRSVQEKISAIKLLMREQPAPVETLIVVHTLLPTGAYLDTLTIDKNKITTNVTADSAGSFTRFLTNFSSASTLTGVEIGKVGKRPSGIQFTLTANIKQPSAEKKN